MQRELQRDQATINHGGRILVYGTRCLTIRQAVRELEDSLPGSPCAVAARTSSCAPCTAAAVLVALIHSSLASADLWLPVKAVPPLPIFSWTGVYVGADVGCAGEHDSMIEYPTGTKTLTG
jgi:hypothetical protein